MGSGVPLWVWTPGKNEGMGVLRAVKFAKAFHERSSDLIVAWALGDLFSNEQSSLRKRTRVLLRLSFTTPALQGARKLQEHVPDGKRESGQADRAISTSPLNTSLCLHAWPINLVVFKGPDREN